MGPWVECYSVNRRRGWVKVLSRRPKDSGWLTNYSVPTVPYWVSVVLSSSSHTSGPSTVSGVSPEVRAVPSGPSYQRKGRRTTYLLLRTRPSTTKAPLRSHWPHTTFLPLSSEPVGPKPSVLSLVTDPGVVLSDDLKSEASSVLAPRRHLKIRTADSDTCHGSWRPVIYKRFYDSLVPSLKSTWDMDNTSEGNVVRTDYQWGRELTKVFSSWVVEYSFPWRWNQLL